MVAKLKSECYAMIVEPLPDVELLRLMLTGDEDAFAVIYRRHQARVYRFALQMSGAPEIAEDVVQETFLTLMREGAKYDPVQSPLAAFLYGVARNHLKRRFARESRFVALADENVSEAKIENSTLNLPALEDPLKALTRAETIEQVRAAILSLPEHYREALVLCELHEMNYADAASALACPVGTIRSRLNRARALLVERLRDNAPERNEKWIAKSLS